MNFLDIQSFDFLKKTDSLLKFRRRSDHVTVSAIAYSGKKWSSAVNEAFFQNLEALNLLSHPNIVKTLGHSIRDTDDGSELLIFIEQSEGTLGDFMETEILSKDDIKSILRDVILTLSSIEEQLNMSPFFLTPRNIIVGKNYFGDNTFKLFCPMMIENGLNLKPEDAKWTSPELFEKIRFENGPINFKVFKNSVIYSLGLLSIFMITGDETLVQQRDFYNCDEYNAQIKETEEINIRKYISESASQLKDPHFMDLILKMLRFFPIDRPDLKELLTKILPSANSSSNVEVRDQRQRANNQGSYAVFVDENQVFFLFE
jgi:serine/threonine protein kinase